jgi:hypothetical protein
MATQSIEQFFTGKSLEIPPYQRDYAWTTDNVDDLFDDIIEAMEMEGSHYLGTFILSAGTAKGCFKVVDGQQRLTTLTMLFDAMVDALPDGDVKTYYRATYLHHPVQGAKFSVLGSNHDFFTKLLNDNFPTPTTEGQARLKSAYEWIRQRVQILNQAGGQDLIKSWLLNIGKLEVLEFIELDEGKAIRMFQSVNDRGVPLSKMDIAKSLLIYYSNRFLDGQLDNFIAEKFGDAFRDYSLIKGLAAQNGYKIRHIDRNSFREDDVFRYHYFAYDADRHNINMAFDYNATSETVLEEFLKPILKKLRSDKANLGAFIQDYVGDLAGFFLAFRTLVENTRTDKSLYLLFVVGDLASTLYPLTIRLEMRSKLSEPIPIAENRTLLQIIEIVDLRVFKLRGTNPQADILSLTRQAGGKKIDEIAIYLRWFVNKFMDDGLFESRLSQESLYRNPGLVRILCAVEEKQRLDLSNLELSLSELVLLVQEGQTVEHILPQVPSFGIRAYGFYSAELYENNIHRLGNLTLLESGLNTTCSNKSVETKMSDDNLYRSSSYKMTTSLAAAGAMCDIAFSQGNIDERGAALAKLCVEKWPVWDVSSNGNV